jgi:hypothetical protein
LGDAFAAGADFASGAGLAAGFAAVFDFVIGVMRADAGRGALNNRGDRSRRSSKLQPRGNVNLEAWSAHNALRWRASSASKFSSHTTQATRSMP